MECVSNRIKLWARARAGGLYQDCGFYSRAGSDQGNTVFTIESN